VHGGGPKANALLERLKITPIKVGGRRVTDQETLEVMKMILPGICNSDILAGLKKRNIPASAVSAISIIEAHKRPPKQVSGADSVVDFGFVGDVDKCNSSLLEALLEKNFLPVISPLSVSRDGTILNINADTIASHVALATRAQALILITKIGGVFANIDDPQSRISQLTVNQAKEKIKGGVIVGGMIPKIEECFKLLEGPLKRVHIVGVNNPTMLQDEMSVPGSKGTTITS
jgi:acetylglutamate kinase